MTKIVEKICCILAFVFIWEAYASGNSSEGWKAGIARVNITPDTPTWMAGYAFRTHRSQGVLQNIWAKALSIEDFQGRTGVIVTLDLLSIPKDFSDCLRDRLCKEYGLERRQIILNVSHTHSGPVIGRALEYIYPIGDEDWRIVDAYTGELLEKLVLLVGESIRDLQPARISTGTGFARFAVNRRNNSERDIMSVSELKGPLDHSVPVLKVEDSEGQMIAVLFGYACHNTALSDYYLCGDYAGFAQAELEKVYPGTMAMFFQGAGGDQNPLPRKRVSYAVRYGKELSVAVTQVLSDEMTYLAPALDMRYEEIPLQMESPLSMDELESIGKGTDYQARWARGMISDYQKGESPLSTYPYPLQYWEIGSQKIFALGGEVVCGYSLDLKSIFGQDVIVMGYSNDVMAYIPTETIWDEGGYEGFVSHRVYGLPARWTRDVHDRIIKAAVSLAAPKTGKKKNN